MNREFSRQVVTGNSPLILQTEFTVNFVLKVNSVSKRLRTLQTGILQTNARAARVRMSVICMSVMSVSAEYAVNLTDEIHS